METKENTFWRLWGEPGNQQRAEWRCDVIHVAATDKCVSPGPGAGDLLTSCGGCGEAEAMSTSSPASLGRRVTGRMVQGTGMIITVLTAW